MLLPDLEPVDRPGLEGLIDRYEQRRRAEDAHIHALFLRLEQELFAPRFEAWVAKHTGIDVDELQPSPARRALMAKPRPVTGIDPSRRVRPNARRILATRIDEVYQYDGLVANPANITDLHNMRIAFKRLRYLLEIFDAAFDADLEPFLEQVKAMQDLLGDIHDCDVQVPMLEAHLAWLERQEATSVERMLTSPRRTRQLRRPGRRARAVPQSPGRRPPHRRAPGHPHAHRDAPRPAHRAVRAVHQRMAPDQARAIPSASRARAGHQVGTQTWPPRPSPLHSSGTSTHAWTPSPPCSTRSPRQTSRRDSALGTSSCAGPEPALCIARIRELGWPTVVGNTDRKVAAGSPRPRSHPASGRIGSRSWTYRELDADDLAWLAALPTLVRLSFGGARVVVIHGDADSLPYPITAETSNRDVERQLRKLEADLLVLGHTHVAMIRTVRNGTVINPGAVGESRTSDWQPHWAWLEATPDGRRPAPGGRAHAARPAA